MPDLKDALARIKELEAENARLRGALEQVRDHHVDAAKSLEAVVRAALGEPPRGGNTTTLTGGYTSTLSGSDFPAEMISKVPLPELQSTNADPGDHRMTFSVGARAMKEAILNLFKEKRP